ncbi:SET domain-containing protein [Nostoc sp. CENA67]|uniref:SET domain-containing protein n=1 Tax=Amazonocrinis nigriterrae CENA67 TaxID=2794033 RepID=A0A8J7L773_9NOST|nr:SET domain-containing protein [Amazonocrinis nigriterrae]MBH8561835.1 SET domain-containing protein [Amazonocrinis nigriterrae CENA67]
MLCIKTEVKESNIPNAGKGLFSLDFIHKGSIIFIPATIFTINKLVLEEEYQEELSKANELPLNTGMRWGSHYFLHSCETNNNTVYIDNTDYINHASNPNLLSCLGLFFALNDINYGDELTLDYRYTGIEKEVEFLTSNQERIIGFSAKEALLQSAQKLISILNEVEDIHCFDLPSQLIKFLS